MVGEPSRDTPATGARNATAKLSKLLPAFGSAMGVYHHGTAQHAERVGSIARAIGLALALDDTDIEVVQWTGLLHDIGKLAVSEEILAKSGPLNAQEWAEIQRHPIVGADILLAISPQLAPVAAGVRGHHERWDGSGYPDALDGTNIPLAARVAAVADVYDALTHPRAYRPTPFTHAAAIEHLTATGAHLYDPDVIQAFRQTHRHPRN